MPEDGVATIMLNYLKLSVLARDKVSFRNAPPIGACMGIQSVRLLLERGCVPCRGQPFPTRRHTLILANRIPLVYNIHGGFSLGYHILSKINRRLNLSIG